MLSLAAQRYHTGSQVFTIVDREEASMNRIYIEHNSDGESSMRQKLERPNAFDESEVAALLRDIEIFGAKRLVGGSGVSVVPTWYCYRPLCE